MQRAQARRSNGKALRVGQRVTYRIGKNRFKALIVEDRGEIGWKRERILLLKALEDGPAAEGQTFELPADALRLAK